MHIVCFLSRILCRALLASDVAQPKQRVLLELYTNLVLFCKGQHFNREQTSVLISIIKNVHQFNTGNAPIVLITCLIKS